MTEETEDDIQADKDSQDAMVDEMAGTETQEKEPAPPSLPDPDLLCGLIITMRLNGEGIMIEPITDNPRFVRNSSPDDMIMLVNAAKVHMDSNITLSKLLNELDRRKRLELERKSFMDKRSQQRR